MIPGAAELVHSLGSCSIGKCLGRPPANGVPAGRDLLVFTTKRCSCSGAAAELKEFTDTGEQSFGLQRDRA